MMIKSPGLLIPTIENIEVIIARCPAYFDEAISAAEAAYLLDSTPGALAQARLEGRGPNYIVDGGRIKYTRRGVIDYLRSRQVKSSTQSRLKEPAP